MPIPAKVNPVKTLLSNWRYLGILIGLTLGLLWAGFLFYPERNSLVAKGPMNTGHEELGCQECHIPVRGTAAQQVSSAVYHRLGLRKSAIGFGSKDVGSDTCLECHERHDDRHPISRFLEPRFAEERGHIAAHECITCHAEHQGKRITISTIGFCVHCHQDTELSDDPIRPTHVELVRRESWSACLRCHDFHGNHIRDTPYTLEDGITEAQVWDYFHGAPSPYSDEKMVEPSRTKAGKEQ